MGEHWITWAVIAWIVYFVGLAGWIIWQRRAPAATLSWLWSLAALPFIGLIVYHLFGPQRLERQRSARSRRRERYGLAEMRKNRLADESVENEVAKRSSALALASGQFPVATAKSVELLVDGAATYGALLKAIAGATDHIHLEYYIYEPDQVGSQILDALAERARAGITVRVLLDAVGGGNADEAFFATLSAAGGQIERFHPIRIWSPKPLLNLRTHRKIAIIDGRIGFTGGVNICNDHDERVCDDYFHDLHMRVEGRGVQWLQYLFIDDWQYAVDESIDGDSLFPDLPAGDENIQVVASGPHDDDDPIYRVMVQAISDARERVWITTPYLVPPEPALMALGNAALAGVDVRIVVPKESDSTITTLAARSYYKQLIELGVRIYEYQPRMIHAKSMVIDDALAIVGTANFDNRSFTLNFEVCVLWYGEDAARTLARFFEAARRESEEVSVDRQIGKLAYFQESVARLLSPIL